MSKYVQIAKYTLKLTIIIQTVQLQTSTHLAICPNYTNGFRQLTFSHQVKCEVSNFINDLSNVIESIQNTKEYKKVESNIFWSITK